MNVNPIRLSFRHQTLPACCTWGTCSTTRFRMYLCDVHACRAKMLAGFPEQTMPPSLPKRRWWRDLHRKASRKTTSRATNFFVMPGIGLTNTAESYSNSLKNWAHRATGTEPHSRWTKYAPKACCAFFATSTTKGSSIVAFAW
ncbi:MAG: hypothetical protein BWZ06_01429 [Bacteroidetes bacterium ADurb.BinA261]|nr:MAG: hypothetical protein BWZ06_01429 [Bacteroidetes bacterium ADurb.BinA261]